MQFKNPPRAQIVTGRQKQSGSNPRYCIVPNPADRDHFFAYNMSGFRSVDLTRGFMVDGWSFGHFTNQPKNLATCVQQYHNSRFVGDVDLTVMNDLSNGNSLVRNGQTHTWNCPPPNTMAVNGLFAFRRELYVSNKVCPCCQLIVHTIQIEHFLTTVQHSIQTSRLTGAHVLPAARDDQI